ncbi:MAG: hypothetical protein ACE5JI_06990 [Acidobacteriota bacterium]
MAEAIPRSNWLEHEQALRRHAYWEFLIQRWLWRGPFTVLKQPQELEGKSWHVPSPQALQDFGWLKEPESQVSH